MMRVTTAMIAMLLATPLAARDWQVDAGASHLRFTGTAQGDAFQGEFKRFTPTIALEPGKPESASIAVEVDVASVDTRNKERDDALATAEVFGFDRFPKAHFRTTSCKAGGNAGAYLCEAELTIRDKTHKLAFPFTFRAADGQATLEARVPLKRLDYDVGTGEWADTETVANEVEVNVQLKLR
jgi:polyisoprenoid-binding protein YceI